MRFGGRREDGRLCRRGAASFCGAFVTVAAAAVVLCAPALAGASTPQSAPMSLIAKMPGLKPDGAQTAASVSDLVDRLWRTGQSATTDVQSLESAGFTSGGSSWFKSSGSAGMMSVLVFNTAAGAASLVKSQEAESVAAQGSVPVHTLATGVPARAFTASGRTDGHTRSASNAYFSVGHCLFEVGDSPPAEASRAQRLSPVLPNPSPSRHPASARDPISRWPGLAWPGLGRAGRRLERPDPSCEVEDGGGGVRWHGGAWNNAR